jgi:hypothetical protein
MQPNEMKWQPIETAPKDGAWVILFVDVELGKDCGIMTGFYIENGEYGYWSDEEYQLFPTHWMPLPEPPCAS